MSLSEKWIASRRAPWFRGLFQFVTIHFTRYDANPPFVVYFFSAKSGLVHHHPIYIISIIAFNIIYISCIHLKIHSHLICYRFQSFWSRYFHHLFGLVSFHRISSCCVIIQWEPMINIVCGRRQINMYAVFCSRSRFSFTLVKLI